MYVLFPAEDIVDFTLSRVIHTNLQQQNVSPTNAIGEQQEQYQPFRVDFEHAQKQRQEEHFARTTQSAAAKTKSKKSKSAKAPAPATGSNSSGGKMAAGGSSGNEVTLRDLHHPALNDALKNHNAVTFKLVRTVSDFTQQLSQIYGQHAEEIQLLVSNFRKRNSELRKERPNCPSSVFHTWETLLQQVEIDGQTHGDVGVILTRQVSRPLLERSFHRKIQSRKVFAHRESFEALLNKQEDALSKSRQEYKSAYLSFAASPGAADLRAAYLDTHNAYVQQLAMTNAMLQHYHQEALPQLLQYGNVALVATDEATPPADAADAGQRSLLDSAVDFVRSRELRLRVGDAATLSLSGRSVDLGRLDLSVKYHDAEEVAEDAEEVAEEGRSKIKHSIKHGIKKIKKSKLKKLIVPIVIIIMLKAITFIPLVIGILGIKAFNALQLGFGSFLLSFGIAAFQLCQKLTDAFHRKQVGWPAAARAASSEGGDLLAFRAYA